jgi:BirA family biotin operon repressor/biotin-[acetyl-CoA-carboxylase] ligase
MSTTFVRTWKREPEVDSTSDLARRLVVDEAVECPLVVVADRQTRGRGRGSHSWWSDEGSLTFTLALDPRAHALRPEHEARLALASAVAIIEALAPWLPPGAAGIRWPNDVEVAGRKLGGLLPERVETPRGVRVLVGIGLNLTTRLSEAPIEIRGMAASLAEVARSPLPADAAPVVLDAILGQFEPVLAFLTGDEPALAARWAELDTLLGQAVRLDLGHRIVRGIGRGIDPAGALRLETEGGETAFLGGQVLRDPPFRGQVRDR